MAQYVAFQSTEQLHNTTDGFIQRMKAPQPRLEPATVETIMTAFLQQALTVFFLRPSELVGLGGGLKKAVALTAETINKASQLVVRRAAKKLDLAQHRQTADYMDEMRRMIPDADGTETWYVVFPIDSALANKLERARELCEANDATAARPLLVEYLHEMTDVALDWYFERPIALLGFGPILRKVADVTLHTTSKATHAVIRRVFAELEGEQVTHATLYMHSLLQEIQTD